MPNPIFASLTTTIFEEMSALARETGAINLGQGFPDDNGPERLRRAAAEAVLNGPSQYPPMLGVLALREAVARHYQRHQALTLDPASQIVVTSGATEAIAASLLALIAPGDEVVLFQPVYDSYLPMVRLAGGVPRLARLTPPHWRIDRAMLESVFSPRTRLVVLNNPLNPAATVAPAEDLALLAEFCVAHDAICICDEVWEQVVFAPHVHRPLLAFPGMAERCVKIGSAGKMFGVTGWKVGFACAAPPLAALIAKAHQFLTFTTPPSLQAAVAWGLDHSETWFADMPAALAESRDRLAGGLRREGFAVLDSAGTYFLNIDLPASGVDLDDRSFALHAVRTAGVASIPVSAFYAAEPVTTILRLCVSKADATLDEGVIRLARARDALAWSPAPPPTD